MSEYLLLLIGTVFVNNIVLVKFLGLCPFMGVSRKVETAIGMSAATTFVLTLSAVLELPDQQLDPGAARPRIPAHDRLHHRHRGGGQFHRDGRAQNQPVATQRARHFPCR